MRQANNEAVAALQGQVAILQGQLEDVLLRFAEANQTLPAQALIAGIGQLLVQFSVSQIGPQLTQKFLDDLKEAVRTFGPAQQ